MRTWTARATSAGAERYRQYFENTLLQSLRTIPGFHGGYLTRRELDAESVEVATFTLWDSLHALEEFTGADTTRAIVEPEAEAMLTDIDSVVINRLVVVTA